MCALCVLLWIVRFYCTVGARNTSLHPQYHLLNFCMWQIISDLIWVLIGSLKDPLLLGLKIQQLYWKGAARGGCRCLSMLVIKWERDRGEPIGKDQLILRTTSWSLSRLWSQEDFELRVSQAIIWTKLLPSSHWDIYWGIWGVKLISWRAFGSAGFTPQDRNGRTQRIHCNFAPHNAYMHIHQTFSLSRIRS